MTRAIGIFALIAALLIAGASPAVANDDWQVPYDKWQDKTIATDKKVKRAGQAVIKFTKRGNVNKIIKNTARAGNHYTNYIKWQNKNQPEACYKGEWDRSTDFALKLASKWLIVSYRVEARDWRGAAKAIRQVGRIHDRYVKWFNTAWSYCP